jgi:hypothetical protein
MQGRSPPEWTSYDKLMAFSEKVRRVWKWMEVANSLAYYDTATIYAMNDFIVQAPGYDIKDWG